MSQYGTPSPYVPPNQGKPSTPHQQQQSPYQTSNHAVTAGFGPRPVAMLGQMVNQGLTNGKPMLNKLGKSLSSRFGNIPFSGSNGGSNTQPVQSPQGYQGQHGQHGQHGQANQTPSYQQSTGTVASPQPQHQQHHQQPQSPQQWGQVQHPSPPPPSTSPYQQQAHSSPYQQPSYFTAAPNHAGQPSYSPQQTQPAPVSQSYTPPLANTTSGYYPPPQHGHGVEQGQTYGQHGYGNAGQSQSQYQQPAVQELQGSWVGQETGVVAGGQSASAMSNIAANTPPPMTAQSPQHAQSTWGSSSAAAQSPTVPGQQPTSPMYASHHGAAPGVAVSQEQHQHWTSTAAPVSPVHAVELPADLDSLQLSPKPLQVSKVRPSAGASGESQAGMWRMADAATESPTDEFYVLADLLFDALDAKFEPRNTGLLEGSKVMGSGLMRLSDEEKRVFSYQSYGAFAKMWSVEGIPHVMVPCQATLAPIWTFSKQTHGQRVRVSESSAPSQTSYTPALNRAGWYKFLFVEAMRAGDSLGEAVAAVCADSYHGGTAGHPDLNKLDRTVDPALRARAGELRGYAIAQACEETRAAMAASR